MTVVKKKKRKELEEIPEFIIVDDQARVFSGLKGGRPVFSEDINDAKPLKHQESFDHMQRYVYFNLEQMFLENVGKKRKHSKTTVSI